MAMIKETKAQERQRQRITKKIYDIIRDKHAIFLTMSFDNETLQNTNSKTRKRYIKKFLKNETALYIANIDFGAKNEREHYHAIIRATTLKKVAPSCYDKIKNMINLKAYKYGTIKADFIGAKYGFKTEKEIKATAKNLYEHAIKETTRHNKIIYSRKAPSESAQIERIARLYKSKLKPQTEQDIINDLFNDYKPPQETETATDYTDYLSRFKKGLF